MSKLSEGELHVQAMRLVCKALADREKNGLEVDWDVLCHMHDHMDVIFRGIEDQRRDDQDELMHTRKDRDHWRQARQEAIEAGELMKAEIATLREQLADAQRAVSDAFAEVNSVREQLDAANAAVTLQRAGIERLQAFVNFSRRLLGVNMNYADVDRLRAGLAELDAEPTPVAEPLDAEGGA